MVTSPDEKAGRTYRMKTDNSFFERVEQFKYLGTTLRNPNYFQEEVESIFNSGNTC
jgi:hypothetical protein